MRQAGFTQLGRRLSGVGKREAQRQLVLSVIIAAPEQDTAAFPALADAFALFETTGIPGEVLLVGRSAALVLPEGLLRERPELRVCIPRRTLSLPEALLLGAGEAVAPHVLLLEAETRLRFVDIRRLLALFSDPRLFAAGFCDEDDPRATGAAVREGRVRLLARKTEAACPAFLLPGFAGVYDRERLLLLEPAGGPAAWPWREADFFCRAWARGWITMADPGSLVARAPAPLAEPAGLRRRLAYFRGEILFLHRHFVDRESRRLRHRFFLRHALRRLLALDAAPALACLVERVRYLFSCRRKKRSDEAVLAAHEIFALLDGGGE